MKYFLALIVLGLMCPITLSAKMQASRESSPVNDFSLRLLKHQIKLGKEKENITLSALSAANTLAVLHALSDNSARKEIEKVLSSPEQVLSIIPNIKRRQPTGSSFYKQPEYAWSFRAAEGMFSSKSNHLEKQVKAFQNSISFVKIDFSSKENPNQVINKWVDGQTDFQIKNFLQGSKIPDFANLIIVNAVSLKGSWKHPFNPKKTHLKPFFTPGKTVNVPMMSKIRVPLACHIEDSGLVSIALPYASPNSGGDAMPDLTLMIIMPGKNTDLSGFIEKSTLASLQTHMPHKQMEVELEFPRFKSCGNTISLNPALQSMGVDQIFSKPQRKQNTPVHVDNIFHQCFLSISEAGTEPLPPPSEKESEEGDELSLQSNLPRISINRPFMWFIYDKSTHCMVFIGAQFDPTPN